MSPKDITEPQAPSSEPQAPSPEPLRSLLLPLCLFSILWLDLIRLLSSQWEAREQYAYGWFVPIFAALLFWRRWADRPGRSLEHGARSVELPAPRPPLPALSSPPPAPSSQPGSPAARWLLPILIIIPLAALLPLRIIYEINRDWPLISWLYTPIVVGLTLFGVYLAGGRPWLRHFAFPIALILVAVVWPYRIEKGLTQGLMRIVADLTVELLGWMNIPAMQRGNLIDLSTGTVGVDEACSGIRSFQSSLMAGLVMGELYRMTAVFRLGLVGCGLVAAFIFNVARTLLLSWQASQHGIDVIDKWHDPAGMTITIACFFVLWMVAVLLARWTTVPRDHGTTRPVGAGQGIGSSISNAPSPPLLAPSSKLRSPSSQPDSPVVSWSRSPVVGRYFAAIGLWSILSIGATEAWYRSNSEAPQLKWSVRLPVDKLGFEKVVLPLRTREILKADTVISCRWGSEAVTWTMYYSRWEPKSIESVARARGHRPDICLPASGMREISKGGPEFFSVGSLKVPFHKYVYEIEERLLFVFFSLWHDGDEHQEGIRSLDLVDRLAWAAKARRSMGQQTLQLILTGYANLEEAEMAVRNELPKLIALTE